MSSDTYNLDQGIKAIIALQAEVDIVETQEQAEKGWDSMSDGEKENTTAVHKAVCGGFEEEGEEQPVRIPTRTAGAIDMRKRIAEWITRNRRIFVGILVGGMIIMFGLIIIATGLHASAAVHQFLHYCCMAS